MAKRDRSGAPRRGRLERLVFSFMGPPQLGDVNAAVPLLPPRPVEVCGQCRQPPRHWLSLFATDLLRSVLRSRYFEPWAVAHEHSSARPPPRRDLP